jgi:MFS family permease
MTAGRRTARRGAGASARASAGSPGPWTLVLQAAAALAVSMGLGRFAYTPILPLMHAQAGLSAQYGSTLATANYTGYLAGALLGIFLPALVRSAAALRASLAVLVVTLVLMGATEDHAAWFALRLAAGVASALVFMIAVSTLLGRLRDHRQHLVGWGFGGVGAGIVLSGAVVLAVRIAPAWRSAWLASAALAIVLTMIAWPLRPAPAPAAEPAPVAEPVPGPVAGPAPAPGSRRRPPRAHRGLAALFVSYSLEGVGYIIAGTFLVAAISQNSPSWAGSGAWVLVGLAALPAPAMWARLGRRWSRPALLCAALVLQAAGIALPALAGGVTPALISAVLFGATFLGVASLVLALGAQLRHPRAVALLTTGYSVGQILGPLVVTPLLRNGYHVALLVGAVVSLAAALAAATLRIGVPGRLAGRDDPVATAAALRERGGEAGAQVAEPLDRLVGEHEAQVPPAARSPSGHRRRRDLGAGEEAL